MIRAGQADADRAHSRCQQVRNASVQGQSRLLAQDTCLLFDVLSLSASRLATSNDLRNCEGQNMAGQVDEEVLDNFRVSEEDFRDLDSIVRRHCENVRYYVYRGSTLGGYDTDDVEDLLKERNGAETRVRSVTLRATGSEGLKFNVEFNNIVAINGQCDDRARLALLATETKAVIQDRMKVRRPNRATLRQPVAACILLFIGLTGFQTIQNIYANHYNAVQLAQSDQAQVPYQQEIEDSIPSDQMLLTQATAAVSKHNLNTEAGLLLQLQIAQLRDQIIHNEEDQTAANYPSYPTPPWWTNAFWPQLVAALATWAAAIGIGYLVLPSQSSVFLIGDEKRKQDKADKRRTQIIWGIGVAFIVGIASSLAASIH